MRNRQRLLAASGNTASVRKAVQAITKARSLWQTGNDQIAPKWNKPPISGSAYFGQAYRWGMVSHYRYWEYIAINAWIRSVAAGESPKCGSLSQRQGLKKTIRKSLGGPKEHHEFVPYDDDHPVVRLFNRPNSMDVGYDLWAFTVLFLKLTGEAHWQVIRNQWGVPVEIWVIPTHWMRMLTGKDGQPEAYFVQSPWGYQSTIAYEEVVSFREHSPLNRYEGYGVPQGIAEWIDVYESKTRMQLASFKNGAVPAVHIKLGESYLDPDDAFLARYYAKYLTRFQGEDNSGRPLITGADVEMKGIEGHRPADALKVALETEDAMKGMILAAYGVPETVLGMSEGMTYGSVEASQEAFFKFSINSLLFYMGQVISEKVIKPTPGHDDGVFFWEDRAMGDPAFKLEETKSDMDRGALTPNERRTQIGMAAFPNGGDNPMVNGVEMPWVKPLDEPEPDVVVDETPQETPREEPEEVRQSLGGGSGGGGGYTMPSRNGHALNGRH